MNAFHIYSVPKCEEIHGEKSILKGLASQKGDLQTTI